MNQALLNEYRIKSSDSDIVDLDSSTPQKFSRHLVFTKAVFKDTLHAGRFVSKLVLKLDALIEAGSNELACLVVNDGESSKRSYFIDQGVYSRNRNFRLYLSSKIGKETPLVAHATSGLNPPLNIQDESQHEAFFLNTLVSVTHWTDDMRILTVISV